MIYGEQSHYYSVLDPKAAGLENFIPSGQFGRFKLWYDPVLKKEYEEYTVSAFGTEKDFQIYQFRRDQWQNLIGVYHVAQTNTFGFKQLRVFTERIPKLLSQMLTISFTEYLYILRQSLVGFQAIVDKFGYIHVEDRMIGINNQGKIRVWSNSKYEKNHSEVPIAAANWMNSKKYEYQMIQSLFDSLDRHAENTLQFLDFQKNKPNNLGFAQTTNYLFNFIVTRGIHLPDYLKNYSYDQNTFKRIEVNHNSCAQLFSKPSISTNDYITSSQSFQYQKKDSQQNFCKSLQYIESSELISSQSYQNISQTPSYLKFYQKEKTNNGDNTDRMRNQFFHDPLKKTKYFGEEVCERKIGMGTKSKSKEKVIIKSSWTSKDMSFKSTTHSGQKKYIDKKNKYNRVAIDHQSFKSPFNLEQNYDQSFMNDSNYKNSSSNNTVQRPRSLICNLTSDLFQITKSVVVQNKQGTNLESNRKLGIKNLSIETGFNSDISLQNPTPSAPTTPQSTKVRNLKSLNQYKQIYKSIIEPSTKKEGIESNKRGLAMISQLKSSFFNKLDDLKKSQIISQHFEQSQKSSNVDISSPLLSKTRGSALSASNNETLLCITRCSEQPIGECPFQNLETNSIHKSAVNSKLKRLNSIVEADGQEVHQ